MVNSYGKILCIPNIINNVVIDDKTLMSITEDHYDHVVNFQKNKFNIINR